MSSIEPIGTPTRAHLPQLRRAHRGRSPSGSAGRRRPTGPVWPCSSRYLKRRLVSAGRGKARVLAHRPEPAAVHRRLHAAGERKVGRARRARWPGPSRRGRPARRAARPRCRSSCANRWRRFVAHSARVYEAERQSRRSQRLLGSRVTMGRLRLHCAAGWALNFPVIQAPIGSATTPELAAAVSNAGGLGSSPGPWRDLDDARALITDHAR